MSPYSEHLAEGIPVVVVAAAYDDDDGDVLFVVIISLCHFGSRPESVLFLFGLVIADAMNIAKNSMPGGSRDR